MDAAAFALLLTPKPRIRSRPTSPPSPAKSFIPIYLTAPSSSESSATPRTLLPADESIHSDPEDLALASCTKRAIAREVLTLVTERSRARREKKTRDEQLEQRAFVASLESCRAAREEEEKRRRIALDQDWQAVNEARRFVETFLDDQWESQRGNIQVQCEFDMDMEGLAAIGAMRRDPGVKACMGLLAAPVIHEQVALSLWRALVWHALGKEPAEDTDEEEEAEDEVDVEGLAMSARTFSSSSLTVRPRMEQRSRAASSDNLSMMTAPPWPRRGLSSRVQGRPRPFIPRRASADNPGVSVGPPLTLTPLTSPEEKSKEASTMVRQPSRSRKASTNLNRAVASFGSKLGHGYGGWLPPEEFSQGVVKGSSGELESATMENRDGASVA